MAVEALYSGEPQKALASLLQIQILFPPHAETSIKHNLFEHIFISSVNYSTAKYQHPICTNAASEVFRCKTIIYSNKRKCPFICFELSYKGKSSDGTRLISYDQDLVFVVRVKSANDDSMHIFPPSPSSLASDFYFIYFYFLRTLPFIPQLKSM